MKSSHYFTTSQRGFMIIELLVGVAIATIVVVGIFTLMQTSLRVSELSVQKAMSAYLLEEGVEAIKIIRDNDFTTLADADTDTTYYLSFASNTWSLTSTVETVGDFTRSVVFRDVYRDANDDIADSGTLDPGTLQATVTVSWVDAGNTAKESSITIYIANIFST